MSKLLQLALLWLYLLFVMWLSNKETTMGRRKQRRWVIFLMLTFCLMGTFRTLGMDLKNYKTMYTSLALIGAQPLDISRIFDQQYEIGICWLAWLTQRTGLGFHGFLFITIIIPFIIVYISIRNKDRIITPFCLYILINCFTIDISRQYLGNGLYLYSLITKSLLISIAFSLLSGLVHYTGYLGLISLPVTRTKSSFFSDRKKFIACLLVVCLIMFSVRGAVTLLNLMYPDNVALNKLSYYMINAQSDYVYASSLHRVIKIIWNLYLMLYILYFTISKYNYIRESRCFKSMKLGLIIAVGVLVVLHAPILAERIFIFFNVGSFLVLDEYINCVKRRKQNIYFFLIINNIIATMYYIGMGLNWRII